MLKQIYQPFILALCVALLGTCLFPSVRLIAFAPFLALLFMRANFLSALWISALTGLLLDIFTSQMRFGSYSFCYCLTALFTYHQRRHFFADKPLALSLYTALIACVCTLLELVMQSAGSGKLAFTARLILVDVIGMSLVDAIYAFVCFTLPMKIYNYLKHRLSLELVKHEE